MSEETFYVSDKKNEVRSHETLAGLSVARAALRFLTVWLLLAPQGLRAFAIGFAVSEWTYLLILFLLMTEAHGARGAVRA